MAKRFTDSEKWKKSWFRTLRPIHKCLWEYIRDNCDHAGIWEVDFGLASMMIGEEINVLDAVEALRKQYLPFASGRRWLIVDFVEFQYGELNPNNNAHKSVISILKRSGVYDAYFMHKKAEMDIKSSPCPAPAQPLPSPPPGAQDKDQDLDMDQAKDLDIDSSSKSKNRSNIELAESVIAYLNLKTEKKFRAKTAPTLAAISGRAKDGYTLDDFKKVIDTKAADWLTDPKMEKHLNPETLFRPGNFEKYLNQKNAGADNGIPGKHPQQFESAQQRKDRKLREIAAALTPDGHYKTPNNAPVRFGEEGGTGPGYPGIGSLLGHDGP